MGRKKSLPGPLTLNLPQQGTTGAQSSGRSAAAANHHPRSAGGGSQSNSPAGSRAVGLGGTSASASSTTSGHGHSVRSGIPAHLHIQGQHLQAQHLHSHRPHQHQIQIQPPSVHVGGTDYGGQRRQPGGETTDSSINSSSTSSYSYSLHTEQQSPQILARAPGRLSPHALAPASISASASASSITSLSPRSPRSPYTSKFSPKNLVAGKSNLNNNSSTSTSTLQLSQQYSPGPSPSPTFSASKSTYHSQAQTTHSRTHPSQSQTQATPRKTIPQPQENIPPSQPHHHHHQQVQLQFQLQQAQPTSSNSTSRNENKHHHYPLQSSTSTHSHPVTLNYNNQHPHSASNDYYYTPTSPTNPTAETSVTGRAPAPHIHIADLQQRLPPLTRAITSSSTTYPSQQHQEHHIHSERRLKTSHSRREHQDDSDFSALNNKHKHSRSTSKGIKAGFHFNFSKPAKSSDRQPPKRSQPTADSARAASAGRRPDANPGSGAGVVAIGANSMNGSNHPPVTTTATTKQSLKQSDTSHVPAPSLPSKSETSLADGDPNSTPAPAHAHAHAAHSQQPPTKKDKASKPKPFTLLSRTKSHREKEGRTPRHTPSPQESREPQPAVPTPRHHHHGSNTGAAPPLSAMELERPEKAHIAQPPKTAAVPGYDRAYRDAMSSSSRNHSSDRAPPSRDASSDRRGHQDRDYSRSHQSGPRDGNGASSFFNNLRREGGRVAESIGKGLFGKGGRSGSTSEREPVDDEHYVLKVINLPLVEQTRLTRISKRLEESRDKTEFWMPAFPWRAIDYLNYKGCDVEGLYRVPGSGPQIKKWQRRFDEQYDVDLFTQEDLYDINIIGSMLKAWLRELPDELFPKEAQDRIARECMGAEKVPQLLIDELSNLSPFNYYLLFAITCHLSLLLAHSDKNKMDFRNLCICFQPCMKIDAFCFKFLVCDWRDCWKGCKTEAKYIEEEYKLFDQPPPPGLGVRKKLEPRVESRSTDRRPSPALVDREIDREQRNLSSSDSNSKRSQLRGDDQGKLKKRSPPPVENGKENGSAQRSASAQGESADGTPRGSNDIRPLSPIKPLSPLGF